MKSISAALKAHLAQPVTTLALCWRLQRTDGTVYAFTSHDQDLTVSGVTYLSTVGFSPSAISTGSAGEVDNLEVVGFFAMTGIAEDDLKRRLFDYASIWVFAVNWADLTMGILKLRRGWLGEVTRRVNGGFQAELRGLTQALTQEFGNVYMPSCRAELGDAQCKIPIKPAAWVPGTYAKGAIVAAATQGDDEHLLAIFIASTGGATGASEPVWNTTVGATTADGHVVWTSMSPYRGIGTVTGTISQSKFSSSVLTLPPATGNDNTTQAVISVRNNISAGTRLDITDGVHEGAWTFSTDTLGSSSIFTIQQVIILNHLAMAVTISGTTLFLTNNSGAQGNITKTGDALGGIVIENFGAPLLDGGTITWLSGLNAGTSMEMKGYDAVSQTVSLWLSMNFPIQAGDRFLYYPNCDKRRDTCFSRFNNILNFRGEPDMPGMDQVLSYPSA